MKDEAKQVAEFRRWYNAQWLGDREHGQTIPLHTGDAKYTEYLDGYTLALGAWITATRAEREACAKVCDDEARSFELGDGFENHACGAEACADMIRARVNAK